MTVELPTGLDPFTGGGRRFDVVATDVAEVVSALNTQAPGLAGHLVDDSGALRPHLLCLVGEDLIRDMATPVQDQVRFLIAVSGG